MSQAGFDFAGLHDKEFEELVFLLAHIELPDLIRTANPDGGLDCFVPSTGSDACPRGFQAKRFSRGIGWKKCTESLDRAIETFDVEHVTFVYANDLTRGQRENFESRLARRHADVEVDYWSAGQLTSRLIGSERGRQVARHIFGEDRLERVERAIRAQRELNTAGQAIEALGAVGDQFSDDPYYLYSAGTHPSSVPGPPPAESAILRLEAAGGGQTRYLEAFPTAAARAAGLQPTAHFHLPDEESHENFKRFLRKGGELALDRVKIEMAELPKYFEELIGGVNEGELILTAPPPPKIIVEVNTDRGHSLLEFTLTPAAAREGWERVFEDQGAGMIFEIGFRRDGARSEINITWTLEATTSAEERLQALQFMEAMSGTGTVRIRDKKSGKVAIDQPSPKRTLADGVTALKQVFEDLVALEEWIEEQIPLPAEMGVSEAESLRRTGMLIVGWERRWNQVSFNLSPGHDPKKITDGRLLMIREEIDLELFGRTYPLGERATYFSDYTVTSQEPAEDGSTNYVLEPTNDESQILTRLERPKEPASPSEH